MDQNKTLVWGGAGGVAALLIVGLGAVTLRRPKPATTIGPAQPGGAHPLVQPAHASAALVGRSGQFRGVSVPVPAGGLVLGRDPPAEGRLSFAETSDVSRRHCLIEYDEASRRFKVTDFGSSNGTFTLPDENKLLANRDVLCRSGQIIRLGRENVFELIAN